MAELTFVEYVILTLIGVFGTAATTAIIYFAKTKARCFQTLVAKVEAMDRRTSRIQKAIILKATLIDKQVAHDHPGNVELTKLVKEMLEDPEGNL